MWPSLWKQQLFLESDTLVFAAQPCGLPEVSQLTSLRLIMMMSC